jgi:hypothetical protein
MTWKSDHTLQSGGYQLFVHRGTLEYSFLLLHNTGITKEKQNL